ncbi:MAG: GAK system CofD-like protein [Desulfovibrio sp.]|nr:GAK system CofD-like protein [Desulfovibrio sp.]
MDRTPWPQWLFFTGGTALRALSHELAQTNPSSLHIVTTFDSGGSTAELRRCFAIPAMGDVRNRLLALADPHLPAPLRMFFQMRMPNEASEDIRQTLHALSLPTDPFWHTTDPKAVALLTSLLSSFLATMPRHFDLRGASLGNIVLTQAFLQNGRDFDATLAFFHQFLGVRGTIIPIVQESLHLGCRLADGTLVLGQHAFKGIRQEIRSIFLTVHEPGYQKEPEICHPPLRARAVEALKQCDAIIYPMGSFYSSVLVNLLVKGVARTLAKRHCPKIFIPNVGFDPELRGCSIVDQCERLLAVMGEDAPHATPSDLLNYVCIDSKGGDYQGRLDAETKHALARLGILVVDTSLCRNPAHHDPQKTLRVLSRCLLHWSVSHGNDAFVDR